MTANHIGDLASIAGLLVSIVGFLATIIGVFRSRRAAEQATKAAREARDSIKLFDIVVDFTSVIALLDQIKRDHREQRWSTLPERYAEGRKSLIRLRSENEAFTDVQCRVIQSALTNLGRLERKVIEAQAKNLALDAVNFNSKLSVDVDRLYEVLVDLKRMKTGGRSDGSET